MGIRIMEKWWNKLLINPYSSLCPIARCYWLGVSPWWVACKRLAGLSDTGVEECK